MEIVRVINGPDVTTGVMLSGGKPIACTLEPPWRFNERNVSCVPVGIYKCKPAHSPKYGRTWMLMNVPGRSGILFHRGNTVRDTSGCILVGKYFDTDSKGEVRLVNSAAGFAAFVASVDGEFTLCIR